VGVAWGFGAGVCWPREWWLPINTMPIAKRVTGEVNNLRMQLLSHWFEQLGKPAIWARPFFRNDSDFLKVGSQFSVLSSRFSVAAMSLTIPD
jgi:hypothetical protein